MFGFFEKFEIISPFTNREGIEAILLKNYLIFSSSF